MTPVTDQPRRRGILYGTHYEYPFGGTVTRPEWAPDGPSDWRRDLALMHETGINALRIRLGLDSELDEIAALLDVCAEHDMQVQLGFMTLYVPDAFVLANPDSRLINAKGEAIPKDLDDYSWPRVCLDHPGYLKARDDLVTACAIRFGSHPAIVAWDIENQPIGEPCYCPSTLARYRADLQARHGDIAAFNAAHGTAFGSFALVEPPREADPSPTGLWRDWTEFIARNLSNYLIEGRDLIRRHAPGAAVSWNVTYPLEPSANAQDWWVVDQGDYPSQSIYMGSDAMTAAGTGLSIELLRGVSPDRELWVTEYQAGLFKEAYRDGVLFRGINLDAEINKAYSHGVKGLMLYRWDAVVSKAEPGINAIVELDDPDTEKRHAIARIFAGLREDEDLLLAGAPVRPRVGIYLTREMAWQADLAKVRPWDAMIGLYGLLMDLGFEVALVTRLLDKARDLAVVAVPYPGALSDGERQDLDAIVANGGQAILELPLTSIEDARRIGASVGVECRDLTRTTYFDTMFAGWTNVRPDGRFGGYAANNRVNVTSHTGRTYASYYREDLPSLIEAGPGGRVLVATFSLGHSYFQTLHHGLRGLIGEWLPASLEPDIRFEGVPEAYRPLVEARILEAGDEALLFVINRSGYAWDVTVSPRGFGSVPLALPAFGAARSRLRRMAGTTEFITRSRALA